LFYLRHPSDKSQGGDLQILRWNKSYSNRQKLKFYKEGVDEKRYEIVETIKYDNNVAVLFLNSIDALHLVSEREVTSYSRCFVNLVGESSSEIFKKNNISKIISSRMKRLFSFLVHGHRY